MSSSRYLRPFWIAAILVSCAFLACDSPSSSGIDPESQAATLDITASAAVVPVRGEVVLTAVLRNRTGAELSGRAIRWGTHTPSLVTVDSVGARVVVRGVNPGTAKVWASSSGVNAEVDITITGATERVEVTPATLDMPLGTSQQFQSSVRDAQGNQVPNSTVVWTTSTAAVLTVSSSGVVTAAGVGTAQVTATAGGRSGSAQVTVTPTAVATVVVAPNPGEVAVGRSIQFFPTLKDASGNVLTGRDVSWVSSNPAVLEINASGLAQARALGNVTVTATSEGKSGTSLTAVVPLSALQIEVTPASVSINPEQTQTFNAIARNAAGTVLTGLAVSWVSSDPSVATITGVGVATGVSPGTTTITAIVDGRSGNTQLSVRSPTPTLTGIAPDTATAGRESDLVITLTGANFTQLSKVRWNGTDRPTEYQSATRLRATVTAADLEEARTANVTVHTPPPGGGTTTPIPFIVKSRISGVVGDTIEDELRPSGDIDEFRFDGRAGQEVNVYFQSRSGVGSEDLYLQLLDPAGNSLGNTYSRGTAQNLEASAFGPIRLPRDGTYTLKVRGEYGTEQGRYRFYVMPVVLAPERIASAVRMDSMITGEDLAPVGDVDEFTFTGTKGQLLNILFQATSRAATDRLEMYLLSPNRTVLESLTSDGNESGSLTDRFELELSGQYTLRIQGENASEDGGSYRFQVMRINAGPETHSALITTGPDISGEALSPWGDLDVFTFNSTARQEVNVFFQGQSGRYDDQFGLELRAPDNTRIAYAYSRGNDPILEEQGYGHVTLSATGTYSVIVEGEAATQGAYRFRIMPINLSPERVTAPITLGTVITGEDLAPVGDVDHFTFTGKRGQAVNVYFQATSGLWDDRLILYVMDPGGRESENVFSHGDDPTLEGQQTGRFVLGADGTYTIRVQGYNWGSQGPYRFRVVPLQ
jgi:hypothetical protein